WVYDTVRNSCGLAIGTLSGLLCLPGLPKSVERLVVAQAVGEQLQDLFGPWRRPDLLRSLDALVDLFHRRLDIAARYRQPLPAILGVAHLVLMVLQVGQGLGHDLTGARFAILLRRRTQFQLPLGQGRDDLGHLATPDPADPLLVNPPTLHEGSARGRRCEHVRQRVDEIQDRHERGEVVAPDRPVVVRAVADKGLTRGAEEAERPRRTRQDRPELRPAHPRADEAFLQDLWR